MDIEVKYEFETEQQFEDELDKTVSNNCEDHHVIDDTLRSYLALIVWSQGRFIESDYDLERYLEKLRNSPLFITHATYIRRQFVHCLLQEDDLHVLLISTSFLLSDARTNEDTFELLNTEGAFPRLVSLISNPNDGEESLHRLLMELLYELARIQRITIDDLACVDDDFVHNLFDLIEQGSDDVNDPYHYPVIRVLLVLNEQFMVAAHDPDHAKVTTLLTNKVIKVLSVHGSRYKTFGENIILLLNREDETSLQLLTLKLLYLLFTTPPTYEYFYTNDLRVLVDILVRNLLDLPEEASALRHTYLRVLYPLLEHTQLQQPPHYKRDEIQKLLTVLGGGQILHHYQDGQGIIAHFEETDETTKRLVRRCQGVSWLAEVENDSTPQNESPTEETGSTPASPVSPTKSQPPALPAPRKLKKRNSSKSSTLTIGQYLTPQLESARQSSLSMIEMAGHREKPGVITPSRNPSLKHGLRVTILNKKEKPPPPKARRSGWHMMKVQDNNLTNHHNKEEEVKTQIPIESEIPSTTQELDTKEKEIEVNHQESDQKIESQNQKSTTNTTSSTSKPTKQVPPPPPAPKTRRWRGKRAKEEDEGGGIEKREPGKFDTTLPSIITTSTDKKVEISPFSPVSPSIGKEKEKEKESVSQALNQAHSEAQAQIQTQAIDLVNAAISNQQPPAGAISEPNPDSDPNSTMEKEENKIEPKPKSNEIEKAREQETEIPPSSPPLSSFTHDHHPQHQATIILTPPAQPPPRSIPAPQMEIEKSPFLSETDSDSENENENENDP